MAERDWIAVDWGTSNLRAWRIGAGGVAAEARSDRGMNSLKPDQFAPALLEAVGSWLEEGRPTRVVACGMVGARQGWMEAPYRFLPCRPAAPDAPLAVPTADERLEVFILPGLAQAEPADVMRGEETQVTGFLARHPDFEGSLCLPGTHSKWIEVRGGEVTSFRTFMTGELFALLAGQSVLRHSLQGEGEDEAAFLPAAGEALDRPEEITGRLFSLRAESLLQGLPAATARSRLSGYLIGTELAAARPYWTAGQVGIIAAGRLARSYGRALAAQGCEARVESAEAMVLAGLQSAAKALQQAGA